VPVYHVTVVCACGVRHSVALGEKGICECGRPYDTNRLSPEVVAQIESRAASYKARRRLYAIQMMIVALALIVIARSAPWQVTVSAGLISWWWFGIRGLRKLRQLDSPATQHPL
jgi:hypothetical protein